MKRRDRLDPYARKPNATMQRLTNNLRYLQALLGGPKNCLCALAMHQFQQNIRHNVDAQMASARFLLNTWAIGAPLSIMTIPYRSIKFEQVVLNADDDYLTWIQTFTGNVEKTKLMSIS
jgi:hypothetical protein